MDHGIVRSSGIAKLHGAQRGWAIHALVYLCVNTGLVALALLQGRTPMLAPALAWGIGLAIHGTVAFLVAGRRTR